MGTQGVNIRWKTESDLLLLHALRQRAGIGSALLGALMGELRAAGTRYLRVATTNDNLPAL